MVKPVPWRNTQLSVAHTRTDRPRRMPSPTAPTSNVATTQAQAADPTW